MTQKPSRRWPAFWASILALAFVVMEATKVNIALDPIRLSLHATSTELLLVVAGYVLTFGLTLVPAGRIGDLYSRKFMLILGIGVFTVASAGCALAPTGELLVLARIVEGVGAGMIAPQVVGVVQTLFSGRERGVAYGRMGATTAIATAMGPFAAGVAIALGGEVDGWRWTFWINIPIGLTLLILVCVFLPSQVVTASQGRRIDIDAVGLLLLTVAIVAFMIPFLLTTGQSTDQAGRWLLLIAFAVAVILFIRWERRYDRRGRLPLVPVRLFSGRPYRAGVLVAFALFAGNLPGMTLMCIYLQQGLGLDSLQAGMISFAPAAASGIAAAISGRVIFRFGRPMVLVGLIIASLGVGVSITAVAALPTAVTHWGILAGWTLGALGLGFASSPNQALSLEHVAPAESGVAGGVMQLAQRVGTVVGVGACLPIYYIVGSSPDAHGATGALARGFSWAMLVTVGFFAFAIVVAVLDIAASRRAVR